MVTKIKLVLRVTALHLLAAHLHLFYVPVSVSVVSTTSDSDVTANGTAIALNIFSPILTVFKRIGRETLPTLKSRLRVAILVIGIVLLVLLLFLILLSLLSSLFLCRFFH